MPGKSLSWENDEIRLVGIYVKSLSHWPRMDEDAARTISLALVGHDVVNSPSVQRCCARSCYAYTSFRLECSTIQRLCSFWRQLHRREQTQLLRGEQWIRSPARDLPP